MTRNPADECHGVNLPPGDSQWTVGPTPGPSLGPLHPFPQDSRVSERASDVYYLFHKQKIVSKRSKDHCFIDAFYHMSPVSETLEGIDDV